jgi:threonylcarbamoyladenosine tRNA methylthiotransferase CDKAL1
VISLGNLFNFNATEPKKMSCGIVDDIEDILKNDNELSDLTNDELNRSANKSFILPKFTKKSPKNNQEYGSENNYNIDETSNIPGLAKIWLKTWGCTHNTSDSEYMAGQLSAYGYKIVGNKKL